MEPYLDGDGRWIDRVALFQHSLHLLHDMKQIWKGQNEYDKTLRNSVLHTKKIKQYDEWRWKVLRVADLLTSQLFVVQLHEFFHAPFGNDHRILKSTYNFTVKIRN